MNCEKGGGIAAIIYNNESGNIGGGLSDGTETSIPALEIRASYGLQLKDTALGETLEIEQMRGYGYLSGTSMSVPHVTGVAGKVWRAVSEIKTMHFGIVFCTFGKSLAHNVYS